MDLFAVLGIGPQEGLIVLVIVLLLFGAKRLPELAKGLGKASKEFRKGQTEEDEEEGKSSEKPSAKPSDE